MVEIEMSDKSNIWISRRLQALVRQSGSVADNPYTYLRVLTVDNDHAKRIYPELLLRFGIQTLPAEDDNEALNILNHIADRRGTAHPPGEVRRGQEPGHFRVPGDPILK
jgi:hypothetical protein